MKDEIAPNENSTPRLAFTAAEAAHALGVSRKTIYRLCARGLLRRSAALRTLRIPRSSIEEFLTK